jgi:hypothetical protein
MKRLFKKTFVACAITILSLGNLKAQNQTKQSAAVLNIDSKLQDANPVMLGTIVRLELQKLNYYNVIDKYDAEYLIQKNQLQVDKCFGRMCMVEVGRALQVDKVIGGSFELIEKNLVVSLSLIDVKTGTVEKTFSKEYLALDKELRLVAEISLRQLLELPFDQKLLNNLTNNSNFPNEINSQSNILRLDGPRFGMSFFTGPTADRFMASKSKGGYNGVYPGVWMFGYQFEKQYLNTGDLQVLFEFIPMINGLDQGLFMPSFILLHGIRSNNTGLEFAFGPSVRIYNADKNSMLDSRGDLSLGSDFVFALGRSFKSGKMNIPINIFVVPNKNGVRAGFSFGFNVTKSK